MFFIDDENNAELVLVLRRTRRKKVLKINMFLLHSFSEYGRLPQTKV